MRSAVDLLRSTKRAAVAAPLLLRRRLPECCCFRWFDFRRRRHFAADGATVMPGRCAPAMLFTRAMFAAVFYRFSAFDVACAAQPLLCLRCAMRDKARHARCGAMAFDAGAHAA